jgi:hypothetical protein
LPHVDGEIVPLSEHVSTRGGSDNQFTHDGDAVWRYGL